MAGELLDRAWYTGPQVEDATIHAAEEQLGIKLPHSYIELLRTCNGGELRRRRYMTSFATSWAADHFEIDGILGIGGRFGIDGPVGSRYLVAEWGYPDIGVVIGMMPSGGHDAVMLDYSVTGMAGEPGVAYVDEDRVPRRLTTCFSDFLNRLVESG